jgi:hypothetical protein
VASGLVFLSAGTPPSTKRLTPVIMSPSRVSGRSDSAVKTALNTDAERLVEVRCCDLPMHSELAEAGVAYYLDRYEQILGKAERFAKARS